MKLYKQGASKYWWLDVTVSGQRHRISLKETDRKVAGIKAKMRVNELKAKYVPAIQKTVAIFEQEFLAHITPRKEPDTIKGDRRALKLLKDHFGPNKPLHEIQPKDADDLFSSLASSKTPPTANSYLRNIKPMFELARRWGYVETNVFRDVKPVRFELPPPRILKPDEIRAFMHSARELIEEKKINPEIGILIQFYLLTGVRRSEALRLKRDDINFADRTIILSRTKGKRYRLVYMGELTVTLLQDRAHLPKPFCLGRDTVTHQVGEIFKRAQITNAKLHDLRKTFATYLSNAGCPDFFVSTLLGHQDRQTTQNHYIGQADEMIRKYMTAVEKQMLPLIGTMT